jgi:hypothetical protein
MLHHPVTETQAFFYAQAAYDKKKSQPYPYPLFCPSKWEKGLSALKKVQIRARVLGAIPLSVSK